VFQATTHLGLTRVTGDSSTIWSRKGSANPGRSRISSTNPVRGWKCVINHPLFPTVEELSLSLDPSLVGNVISRMIGRDPNHKCS